MPRKPKAPPAPLPLPPFVRVLVPPVEIGFGTGKAVVIDARSGMTLILRNVESFVSVDRALYVAGRQVGVEDGLTRVLFPDGQSCWVRDPLPAAAEGAAAPDVA